MNAQKYVALASTTTHDYSFFAPLVAEAWKKIGYTPIMFFVGDGWDCGHAAEVMDRISGHFVRSVDGIEDATLAQSVRLHAAALPWLKDSDLLIPSDADLIPIRKEFYHQHNPDKYAVGSYYSNGYPGEEEHFPSCHISATVATWREFMEIEPGDPRDACIKTLKKHGIDQKMADKKADQQKNWGHVWFVDEHSVSSQIINSRFYPDSFQRIERSGHPPKDRLDRSCWPEKYNPADYTDCHSIRPGWSRPNWPRLRPLIEYLLPDQMEWIDRYREDFKAAMGCEE